MTKTGGTGKNLKSGKGSISVNKNVILLIEDEEKLSRTLAEYLELNGYRVLRALNGLEGLSMFYDHMHEVDLICWISCCRVWMAVRSSRRFAKNPMHR